MIDNFIEMDKTHTYSDEEEMKNIEIAIIGLTTAMEFIEKNEEKISMKEAIKDLQTKKEKVQKRGMKQ